MRLFRGTASVTRLSLRVKLLLALAVSLGVIIACVGAYVARTSIVSVESVLNSDTTHQESLTADKQPAKPDSQKRDKNTDTNKSKDKQTAASKPPVPSAPQSAPKPQQPTSAPTPTPTPGSTPEPTPPPSNPPVSGDLVFPTIASTGPRTTNLTRVSGHTSTSNGQIIQNLEVTGRLTIQHDNVIVRNVKINGTGTYMITTDEKSDGACPVNVRFEYIEIDGALAAENDIPIYSSCGNMTIDHAYIHNVGRTSRLTNNMAVTNSYVFSNRTGGSGAHRGAVGTNGGSNNVLRNNVLKCEGRGCSAAIPNYGDFAPVENFLIEHNLLATTGGYCAYGGSLSGKPYPLGSNIDFINNHFSTEYSPNCGQYGPIASFANDVRGNEWRGNVWHETGVPINL